MTDGPKNDDPANTDHADASAESPRPDRISQRIEVPPSSDEVTASGPRDAAKPSAAGRAVSLALGQYGWVSMNEDSSDATPRSVFWASMAVGGAISLFGAVQLVRAKGNGLSSFIPWFVGGAILLDLAIVPLAAGVGYLTRKVLPGWAWPPVRAGVLITALLVAFAMPLLLGFNATPENPSVQPRNYATGLLAALVLTWVLTAIAVAIAAITGRGDRSPSESLTPA